MQQINWLKVRKLLMITVPITWVLIVLIALAIDWWRARDGYCVQYKPDGSRQLLYGSDCFNNPN